MKTVDNGKEAIALLEKQSFDLVLMDVQMPVMDGLEATRIIRDPHSKVMDHKIPVIAFTSLGCRERCLEAGMNAYLSKSGAITKLYETLVDFMSSTKIKERQ